MINCNYNSISLDVRTFCATIHSLTQSIGFVETIELNRFKWFEEGKQKHLKHLNVPTFFLTDTTKFNSKCFCLKLFFFKKSTFCPNKHLNVLFELFRRRECELFLFSACVQPKCLRTKTHFAYSNISLVRHGTKFV